MNELQLLNDFIIDRFDENDLVNTISIVPTMNIDANKENIYPLVNIDLTATDIQFDAIVASYKITVVQQREIASRKIDSKLLTDSNYLDNVNETHAICAKFINYVRWLHNTENIALETITELKPLKNWGAGGLDGFQFELDLSIHNKGRVL